MSRPIYANVGVKPQQVTSAAIHGRDSRAIETDSQKVSLVNAAAGRLTVFATRSPRRSIDVYVQPPASMPATSYGRVWVYARTQTGRFLVATGFFTNWGNAASSVWVCSASAECLSFEVDYQPLGLGAWVNDDIVFSYVASDVPSCPPPTVGVVPSGQWVMNLSSIVPRFGAPPVTGQPFLDIEIVKVVATNTTAAQAWVQAVDALNVAAAAGQSPVWSYGIPAYDSIALGPEYVSGYRFGANGCVVGGSSTPDPFTALPFNSLVFQVWVR